MSLVPSYTCTICRRTLTMEGPAVIGEERLARVEKMLAEHMGENHRQEIIEASIAGNQFAGMLVCHRFQHTDQELRKRSLDNAQRIRQFSGQPFYLGRYRVSDEMIEKQVPLNPDRATVVEMLKSMRDALDEAQPEPSRVISA